MNDDEQYLRDRLHAIDVPPSGLRPDDLIPAGRRRAFRRRGAQAAGAVALATGVLLAVPTIVSRMNAAPAVLPAATGPALFPAPVEMTEPPGPSADPTAPPSVGPPARNRSKAPGAPATTGTCPSAGPLRLPAGLQDVEVFGVDPSGRYVVGAGSKGQDFRPVLWTDGVPRAMPLIGDSVQPTDVNAAGTVVGIATTGTKETIFRYEDGAYTKLRLPAGSWNAYPEPRINATGEVLINVKPVGVAGDTRQTQILRWRPGAIDPVRYPAPAGSAAHDLNDRGFIVGGLYEGGVGKAARMWTPSDATVALAATSGKIGLAYAVQGDWVTGGLWDSDGNASAALWNPGRGTVADLGGDQPGAAVNSRGWVVTMAGEVRRSDGTTTLLGADGRPAGEAARARGIADTGLVVGDNGGRPYTWQC